VIAVVADTIPGTNRPAATRLNRRAKHSMRIILALLSAAISGFAMICVML
jgi:hypothetical protein